jgi:hypothetical protein
MLSAVGKFFAAVITVGLFVWLAPMCARVSDERVVPPVPAVEPAPTVSTVTVTAPAPAPEPEPAPLVTPAAKGEVTLKTYRMKKMFEQEKSRYQLYVVRTNQSDVTATDVRMSLITRMKGNIVEQVDGKPQTLAPGTTGYAGLSVSTAAIDEILDAPEDAGAELEWSLTYRLEGDAPKTKRCFQLRVLPRRRQPEGIFWRAIGESRDCRPSR